MKIEEIRELVALLEKSDLNVLEISEGDSRIRLEKAAPAVMPSPVYSQMIPQAASQMAVPAALEASSPGGQQIGGAASQAAHGGKAVKSPMVGVFYGAAAPGEEPFVSVGSRVEKGDVLCIVEAMKLMNEITAEISGEIMEVCNPDGEVVEFGQPLFYIK